MAELLRLVNCEAIQPDRQCVIGRCAHIHYGNAVHPILESLKYSLSMFTPAKKNLAKLLFMTLALAHECMVSNRKKVENPDSRLGFGGLNLVLST